MSSTQGAAACYRYEVDDHAGYGRTVTICDKRGLQLVTLPLRLVQEIAAAVERAEAESRRKFCERVTNDVMTLGPVEWPEYADMGEGEA
jgi:hypothetical protein